MAKQTHEETAPEAEVIKTLNPFVLPIQKDYEPVDMATINEQMGLSGPRIPAENLKDVTFVILGAKAYQSSYDPTKHVYFCVCKDEKRNEVFTTSLGGSAVVDVLDSLSNAGFDHPLRVTLREKEGGQYGRYYVLE